MRLYFTSRYCQPRKLSGIHSCCSILYGMANEPMLIVPAKMDVPHRNIMMVSPIQ